VVIAAALCALVLALAAFAWALIQLIRRRITPAPATLGIISLSLIGAVYVGMVWSEHQRAGNNQRGSVIGRAMVRYQRDNGHYPRKLGELRGKYLDSIPTWRHGFLPVPFIYWLDYDGSPNLKYVPSPWTGVFYSFEDDRWYSSTL